jgi:hypothetical protein
MRSADRRLFLISCAVVITCTLIFLACDSTTRPSSEEPAGAVSASVVEPAATAVNRALKFGAS